MKKIPKTLKEGEFTLHQLGQWYKRERPTGSIGMTLGQEMWYRNLLPPEFVVPKYVSFRGHKVVVY